MLPEYEDGRVEEVTSAGDIYSLGKLLYWLLSGGATSPERASETGPAIYGALLKRVIHSLTD